jgi:hypothetical protein
MAGRRAVGVSPLIRRLAGRPPGRWRAMAVEVATTQASPDILVVAAVRGSLAIHVVSVGRCG